MALLFLKILKRLRKLAHSTDDFNVFWENLWEPKCNICLFPWLRVCKFIHSLDYNDNFLVDILCTENYFLFLNLGAAYVEPVSKILSYFLFEKINTLFQFQGFPKLNHDSIKTVEVITVISAIAGKVNNRKNFVFLHLIFNYLWSVFF